MTDKAIDMSMITQDRKVDAQDREMDEVTRRRRSIIDRNEILRAALAVDATKADINSNEPTVKGRLTREEWERFEVAFTGAEKEVVTKLCNLGKRSLELYKLVEEHIDDEKRKIRAAKRAAEKGEEKEYEDEEDDDIQIDVSNIVLDMDTLISTSGPVYSVISEEFYLLNRPMFQHLLYTPPAAAVAVSSEKEKKKSKKQKDVAASLTDVPADCPIKDEVVKDVIESYEQGFVLDRNGPLIGSGKTTLPMVALVAMADTLTDTMVDKYHIPLSEALDSELVPIVPLVAKTRKQLEQEAKDAKIREQIRIGEEKDRIRQQALKEKQIAREAKDAKKKEKIEQIAGTALHTVADLGAGLKKEDRMRMQNTAHQVTEEVSKALAVLEVTEGGKSNPSVVFRSKYLEIRGMAFLYFCKILYEFPHKYLSEKHLHEALSMLTGAIRFYDSCAPGYDGKTQLPLSGQYIVNSSQSRPISTTFLADLKTWIDVLIGEDLVTGRQMYPYDGFTIHERAPHLLVTSDFTDAIPSQGIVLREFQKKMMEVVVRYYSQGFFLAIKPAIGVGKTISVAAYCHFLMALRQWSPALYGLQFALYTCDTEPVRETMGKICFNGDDSISIPFAVATMDPKTGKPIVIKHDACEKSKQAPVLIIADSTTAVELINMWKEENIAMWLACDLLDDEPTIGADLMVNDVPSASLKKNVELLTLAPKRTILFSATLPDFVDIPNIVGGVRTNFPQTHFEMLSSDEIQIGISVYRFDKRYITPFVGCKTAVDLRRVIERINNNAFLIRLCTSEVTMTLWRKMTDALQKALRKRQIAIPFDIPDIKLIFKQPKNMTPQKVKRVCIALLETLSRQNEQIIEEVCSLEILTKINNVKEKEETDDLFSFSSGNDETDKPIDPFEITTRQSTIFKGQTLVSVGNAVEHCNEHYGELFRTIIDSPVDELDPTKGTFRSMANALSRYNSAFKAYEVKRLSIERNTLGGEIGKSQALQTYADEKMPTFSFPKRGVINSGEHIRTFSGGKRIKVGLTRSAFPISAIPVEKMSTPDWIVTLLFAGIGIFATHDKTLCSVYRQTVSKLASEGHLAFVVADDTIDYGTNWPFVCCVVHESSIFVRTTLPGIELPVVIQRSTNSLFQRLGRAGRFNKSWYASAFGPDIMADMIIAYSQNPSEVQVEAINMNRTYELVIREKAVVKRAKYLEQSRMLALAEGSSSTGGLSVIVSKRPPRLVEVSAFVHDDAEVDQVEVDRKPSATEAVGQPNPVAIASLPVHVEQRPMKFYDSRRDDSRRNYTSTNGSSSAAEGGRWERGVKQLPVVADKGDGRDDSYNRDGNGSKTSKFGKPSSESKFGSDRRNGFGSGNGDKKDDSSAGGKWRRT